MSISSPSDISGCKFWGKADTGFQLVAGTTALSNGNPIGYLTDLSGNGNHRVAAADNSTRPTYVTGVYGVAGFPVVRTDGSNDLLAGTMASIAQPCSVSALFRKGSAAANKVPFGGNSQCFLYDWGATDAKMNASAQFTFSVDVTQFNAITAVYSDASSFVYVNASKTTGTAGSTGFGADFAIGGWGNNGFLMDIDLVGVAVYDVALTDGNCTDLQAYWESLGAAGAAAPVGSARVVRQAVRRAAFY